MGVCRRRRVARQGAPTCGQNLWFFERRLAERTFHLYTLDPGYMAPRCGFAPVLASLALGPEGGSTSRTRYGLAASYRAWAADAISSRFG